jgi:tetratricopeptide (TPR) repeat protein
VSAAVSRPIGSWRLLLLTACLGSAAAAPPAGVAAAPAAGVAAAAAPVAAVAPAQCAALLKHGQRSAAAECYGALTGSADPYLAAEGQWGLGRYQQANDEFRLAVERDPASALYRIRWGRLLHERFNDTEAAQLFTEALQREPKNAQAYLGLALVSADGFDDKAMDYLRKALQLDPALVPAHELMATLALEDSNATLALEQAGSALSLDPQALDAMAVQAAAALLSEQSPEPWLQKIRQINPGYGAAYALLGHHLELNRRYEEAATYYRRAIELDPQLWSARSQLAIDLMRLGQLQEPQQLLETSYRAGYRDPATVNSLRLLDTLQGFVSVQDETSILKFDRREAELLQLYFKPLLDSALATYAKKYHMHLTQRVQVEVYPNHEDFAVRTLGLPGLGALGVTFGSVVAMDSPSGRKPGSFNWAATLWHEMNHVFILTATHHRVPRWFAEGLAVHEQSQAKPEWADHLTPDIVVALAQKKLLPVAQLDSGFVRQEYPGQILVSYYEAGRICDYIQATWGADKLLDMVHLFAEPTTTAAVIHTALGLEPAQFDSQFQAWLYQDVGGIVERFDSWRERLKQLVQLVNAHQDEQALLEGEAVRRLYPQYVDDANAYGFLAAIYVRRKDVGAAIGVLRDYQRFGGDDPTLLEQLATLQQQSGQLQAAAATLDAVNDIYPVNDEALHERLGQLWLAQHDSAGAIREYSALVASQPLDQAGALFHLAQAYQADHQSQAAEQNVLKALEAAPGYRPAQQLLLQLEASTPSPSH